jgi:hypothetical protein
VADSPDQGPSPGDGSGSKRLVTGPTTKTHVSEGIMKECAFCGQEFEGKGVVVDGQAFCSQECAEAYAEEEEYEDDDDDLDLDEE